MTNFAESERDRERVAIEARLVPVWRYGPQKHPGQLMQPATDGWKAKQEQNLLLVTS